MSKIEIEVRDASARFWSATGWATTWSRADRATAYFVHDPREGTFKEQMSPGAFPDAVTGTDAVELRLEHDAAGPVFASTSRRSLKFSDMGTGLHLAAALRKSDHATATAVAQVKAGTLNGLSVGMVVTDDHWGTDADGRTALRTIKRASLSEVSLVQRPANPAAQVVAVRHEQRSDGRIEYRSVPLSLVMRQMGTDSEPGTPDDMPDDAEPCAECDATGTSVEGYPCAVCGGLGWIEPDDSEAGRAARGKYAAHELAQLGSKGMAFKNPDGHWSYPTATPADIQNAIQAIGRAPAALRPAIRRYIAARARKMGLTHLVPAAWNKDGTTSTGRSRSATPAELRQRATSLRAQALELEGEQLIRRDRLRRGLPEHDGIERFRRASQAASAARARGDLALARTFDRVAEHEAEAAALGL
jgi:HK97 family phage prohead protease